MRSYAYLIAAAVLVAVAQTFPWAGWLALLAPLPLVVAVADSGFWKSWRQFGLFYAIQAVLTLHWIGRTGPGMLWLLPIVIVYAQLFLAIPALCLWAAGRSPLRLAVLPPAWALAEIAARRTLFELNWTLLGQPLADYPLLSQTASLAGPEAVSFMVLAVTVAGYLAVRGDSRRFRLRAALVGAGLIAFVFGWGALQLRLESSSRSMNVAIIQPVNSQKLLWTPANRKPVLDRMNALIDEASRFDAAMIVLPESAFQGLVRYDNELTGLVRDAVLRTERPLLFGSADYQGGKYSNVAILITPYNTVTTYRKIHLVPFVEYTPKGFPYSPPKEWPRFTPGTERTVFGIRDAPLFSVGICLEDTLPELAREYAAAGSQALVSLVNTENFLGTSQSLQHLRRARLAAIASGLPIVRAANSGISASIDSRGRVLARVEEGVPRAALLPVATSRGTLYRIIGDLGAALLFLAAIAAVLARRVYLRPAINRTGPGRPEGTG